MSDNLNRFLVDLASDSDRMNAFLADPTAVLDLSPLSEDEKAAMLTGDSAEIRSMLPAPDNPTASSKKPIKKKKSASKKKKSNKKKK